MTVTGLILSILSTYREQQKERREMTNIKIDRTANKALRNKALRQNGLSKELKLMILLDAIAVICTIINVGQVLQLLWRQ